MENAGNIFDNSAVVAPVAGQGEATPAGNAPIIEPAATAPNGQAVQGAATDPNTVQANTQPDGTTAPNWQTEYGTPEEMHAELQRIKQSYANLRPQFTKVTQELSAIRKGQTVDNQRQTDPQQTQTPVDAILNKVAEIVRPVKEQNEELMMQNEVARIASVNPDFMQLAPEISKTLKDNPQYWNIPNPIETVYRIVKADKANEVIATATANARNQAYADKELKILNPAAARTQVNTAENQKTPEQIIKEGILSAVDNHNSIF